MVPLTFSRRNFFRLPFATASRVPLTFYRMSNCPRDDDEYFRRLQGHPHTALLLADKWSKSFCWIQNLWPLLPLERFVVLPPPL
jgi:hypothetical protein